jgi:D-beta-D-heptose 7-phosphate kinase/D-beta-D-heptose 1-phosphate adenosyltransferase
LDTTGAEMAVVTLDADGALVLDRSGGRHRAHGRPIRHARAAGAGDTFGAAFALALSAGADARVAAELASAASAFVVGQDGTAVCTAADLRRTIDAASKLLERRALAACVASHRQHGRSIVFTNGCFDLLHPGHVRYLAAARAAGDLLVVGVNSDRSVRALNKAPGRPINSEAERCEVLAALASVDAVVVFDEDTPHQIIAALQPDILVKGADWGENAIVGRDVVEARGGKVIRIALAEGYSTTEIIKRARL